VARPLLFQRDGGTDMRRRFASEFTPRFSDFDMQGIMSSRSYLDFLVEARIDQMARCYEIPLERYAERARPGSSPR